MRMQGHSVTRTQGSEGRGCVQSEASALSGHQSAKLLGDLLTWSRGVQKYIAGNKSSQNAMHFLLIWSHAAREKLAHQGSQESIPGVSAVHAALRAGASPCADVHLALVGALHPARGRVAPRAKVVRNLEVAATPAPAPPPATTRHTRIQTYIPRKYARLHLVWRWVAPHAVYDVLMQGCAALCNCLRPCSRPLCHTKPCQRGRLHLNGLA